MGAGLLAQYAIAAAKRQGIKVIADANPADAELVRGYGADIAVERGPGFAEAIRPELPNGVGALLDTASLGEKSFGAIRDGGIYIPVRSWGDKPAERGIKIKPLMYPVSSNGIMVRERLRHEERHGRRTKGPELLSASRSTYRAKADGIRFRLRFGNPLLGRLPFGPGYQIPRKLESSQILLMGGTGCGKSTAIRQLLRQVQERGESAIVYDPAMDFVGEFYDPKRGDLIQHGHRNRESRTPNG